MPLAQTRVEQLAGSVPWRRFRSRQGQAHMSGRHWSATTGGHVVYESRLELARLLLADFDPDVAGIWAQPCRLEATIGGAARGHVPDFLLVSSSGVVTVVNVKPADRLADAKVAEALAWPGRLFADHGWRYEVWSGCDPVVLDNVRFLAGYRRPQVIAEQVVALAWEKLADGEPLGIAERRLAGQAPRPITGWHPLEWEHAADLNRPLSSEALDHARGLAAATGRFPDLRRTLVELLERWGAGLTQNAAERRMALRLSEQRLRLIGDPATPDVAGEASALPSVRRLAAISDGIATELPTEPSVAAGQEPELPGPLHIVPRGRGSVRWG